MRSLVNSAAMHSKHLHNHTLADESCMTLQKCNAIFQFAVVLQKIKEIMDAVTIPVMAKCRIGHFAEAQILEALGVDFIDESEGKKRD